MPKPAKTPKQRKAAGMALAAKRGKAKVTKMKGAAKDMYESMNKKQLKELASKPESSKKM